MSRLLIAKAESSCPLRIALMFGVVCKFPTSQELCNAPSYDANTLLGMACVWVLSKSWIPWCCTYVASPGGMVCRMMLVGLGGNNGTTITGGIIANKQCASFHSTLTLCECLENFCVQAAAVMYANCHACIWNYSQLGLTPSLNLL